MVGCWNLSVRHGLQDVPNEVLDLQVIRVIVEANFRCFHTIWWSFVSAKAAELYNEVEVCLKEDFELESPLFTFVLHTLKLVFGCANIIYNLDQGRR